jgi:hypothetical protein
MKQIRSDHTKTATRKGVQAMKSVVEICVVGSILTCATGTQESPKPALQKGVSVQMPIADHAVEMWAADEQDATVVAITAGGELFVGIKPVEPCALSHLSTDTVYVKADSRAPYQRILTVLDALRGKSVVLLAEPPTNVERARRVPPYGMKLIVVR